MEELKAMFRVCAHIKKDGVRCNSPAMKGMNFCYQHIGGKIRELTRARSIYSGPKLDFVYPGCRQAIQHNFFVIAQAMNDGKIDLQTACAYNRIYSACERNLRRFETLYQKDAEAELAPLPDEAPGSETSPTDVIPLPPIDIVPTNKNAGASFKRSLSGENVGAPQPALSLPKGLEEMWEQAPGQHQPTNAIPTETRGGPLKPGFGLSGEHKTPTDVIPTEVTAVNEVEGSAVSQPSDNLGAPFKRSLSGEEKPDRFVSGHGFSHAETSPEKSGASAPEGSSEPAAPPFDILTIDSKKYDARLKELERLYSGCPDYYDRVRAGIRQFHEEEEQAWRAAG